MKIHIWLTYGIAHAEADHLFRLKDLMVRAINRSAGSAGGMQTAETVAVVSRTEEDPAGEMKQIKKNFHNEKWNENEDRTDERITDLLRRLENIKNG